MSLCTNNDCNNNYRQIWSKDDCFPLIKTARNNNGMTRNEDGVTETAGVRCCNLDNDRCRGDAWDGQCPNVVFETPSPSPTPTTSFSIFDAVYICQDGGTAAKKLCNVDYLLGSGADGTCGGSGCNGDGIYIWSRDVQNWTTSATFEPTSPTVSPSSSPSRTPTFNPSHTPTTTPSTHPSISPTKSPNNLKEFGTTNPPTMTPSDATMSPTMIPTALTDSPTVDDSKFSFSTL